MKKSSRILFVTTSLVEGGAGKMVRHIAEIIAKDYSDVYAVALNADNMRAMDNDVHYLEPLCEHNGGFKGFYKSILSIRKVIKSIKPDVVVSFVSDVAVCTRIATWDMKRITVVSAERGDPFTLNKMWQTLTKVAYKYSDYCLFQLEGARDFFGTNVAKKSFVIPNAAFFKGAIGSHVAKNKTIVTAGRFVWEKGFEDLIEAFKIVHDKYEDYRLIIYGDGPFQKMYDEKIKELHLSNLVCFPGYTCDIAEALKNEGIFVLPSRYEGIPNVLIEALLVGIPTVSCDCTPGGPRFLTNGGEKGLLVPVGNIQAIAKSIIRLIESQDEYNRLSIEGPRIIEKLSPSIIENQWKKAFKEITS